MSRPVLKRVRRTLLFVAGTLVLVWCLLTLWVEMPGGKKTWLLGAGNGGGNVLVVFDPDPIYNLDEKVCLSLGRSLADSGYRVRVATVSAAAQLPHPYDLYVVCANTYNWQPDWAVSEWIETAALQNRQVCAITLGAGSTGLSQKALTEAVVRRGGHLLQSVSYWLLRPNDENRAGEKNTAVAVSQAFALGKKLCRQLHAAAAPATIANARHSPKALVNKEPHSR